MGNYFCSELKQHHLHPLLQLSILAANGQFNVVQSEAKEPQNTYFVKLIMVSGCVQLLLPPQQTL